MHLHLLQVKMKSRPSTMISKQPLMVLIKEIMIITGDFNAKVGGRSSNKNVMGNCGSGEQNERGEMLVDFCQENHLIILNTFFTQHPRRLYTWSSPDQTIRNQIDFILIQKRWRSSCASAKDIPRSWLWIRPPTSFGNREIRKPVKYDMNKIDDSYRVEVKNRFRVLFEDDPEESTPEELWQEI